MEANVTASKDGVGPAMPVNHISQEGEMIKEATIRWDNSVGDYEDQGTPMDGGDESKGGL